MQLNELHITCKPLGYICNVYMQLFHIKKISFYQKYVDTTTDLLQYHTT